MFKVYRFFRKREQRFILQWKKRKQCNHHVAIVIGLHETKALKSMNEKP